MSLEALLGPFTMTTDGIANSFEGSRPFWLDNLGLCGFFVAGGNGTGFKYQIVQYDGIAQVRNNAVNVWKKGHLTYDFQTGNLTVHSSSPGLSGDGFALFDPYTGNSILPTLVNSSSDMWTRYFDRYLRAENGRMYAAPLSATSAGALVLEYTFPFPSGRSSGVATLSDYGGGFIAVAFIDGDIWIYDPVNMTHIGEWKTTDTLNAGLWYSKRFNVWISSTITGGFGGILELRVWANETRPDSISDPVALQAIQPGRVSDIRVQLLGGAGEPVNGQLVEFELVSGEGVLLNEQALTDVDGYAIARLATYPGASGSTQIDATTSF